MARFGSGTYPLGAVFSGLLATLVWPIGSASAKHHYIDHFAAAFASMYCLKYCKGTIQMTSNRRTPKYCQLGT